MANKFSTIVLPLISRRMVTLYVCVAAMMYHPDIAQYIVFLGAAVIGVSLSDSILKQNQPVIPKEEPKE